MTLGRLLRGCRDDAFRGPTSAAESCRPIRDDCLALLLCKVDGDRESFHDVLDTDPAPQFHDDQSSRKVPAIMSTSLVDLHSLPVRQLCCTNDLVFSVRAIASQPTCKAP